MRMHGVLDVPSGIAAVFFKLIIMLKSVQALAK